MNYLRLMAGAFAGTGGLLMIWLGVQEGMQELILGGSLLISNMFTFFVGEANGQRKAETTQ